MFNNFIIIFYTLPKPLSKSAWFLLINKTLKIFLISCEEKKIFLIMVNNKQIN